MTFNPYSEKIPMMNTNVQDYGTSVQIKSPKGSSELEMFFTLPQMSQLAPPAVQEILSEKIGQVFQIKANNCDVYIKIDISQASDEYITELSRVRYHCLL